VENNSKEEEAAQGCSQQKRFGSAHPLHRKFKRLERLFTQENGFPQYNKMNINTEKSPFSKSTPLT